MFTKQAASSIFIYIGKNDITIQGLKADDDALERYYAPKVSLKKDIPYIGYFQVAESFAGAHSGIGIYNISEKDIFREFSEKDEEENKIPRTFEGQKEVINITILKDNKSYNLIIDKIQFDKLKNNGYFVRPMHKVLSLNELEDLKKRGLTVFTNKDIFGDKLPDELYEKLREWGEVDQKKEAIKKVLKEKIPYLKAIKNEGLIPSFEDFLKNENIVNLQEAKEAINKFYEERVLPEKLKLEKNEIEKKTKFDDDSNAKLEKIKEQHAGGAKGVESVHGILEKIIPIENNKYILEINTGVPDRFTLVADEDDLGLKKDNLKEEIEEYNKKDFKKKYNRVYYFKTDEGLNIKHPTSQLNVFGTCFKIDGGTSFESFAVDFVVIQTNNKIPERVLLIQRPSEKWATPGGMVDPTPNGRSENPLHAAKRELLEETGIPSGRITLQGVLGYSSASQRKEIDIRRVGTTVFYGTVEGTPLPTTPQPSEILQAKWVPLKDLDDYEFAYADHKEFIEKAVELLYPEYLRVSSTVNQLLRISRILRNT